MERFILWKFLTKTFPSEALQAFEGCPVFREEIECKSFLAHQSGLERTRHKTSEKTF